MNSKRNISWVNTIDHKIVGIGKAMRATHALELDRASIVAMKQVSSLALPAGKNSSINQNRACGMIPQSPASALDRIRGGMGVYRCRCIVARHQNGCK